MFDLRICLCDIGQILLCTVKRKQVLVVNNVGTKKKYRFTGKDGFSSEHPPTHKSLQMQFILCFLLLAPRPVFDPISQRIVIKIEIFTAYVFGFFFKSIQWPSPCKVRERFTATDIHFLLCDLMYRLPFRHTKVGVFHLNFACATMKTFFFSFYNLQCYHR